MPPWRRALSTATCGAFTVLVLVRLFRRLGLSEPVVAGLTLTYCFNPVMIFYCANGMSEASFYLSASVFLLGIVLWFKEGGSRSLVVMSLGLAAAMAIREEAIFLVPLVAVLVAFGERGWARPRQASHACRPPRAVRLGVVDHGQLADNGEPSVLARGRRQWASRQCAMATATHHDR